MFTTGVVDMGLDEKVRELINSLGGEIITLDVPVKTVKQAAEAVKSSPSNIIKSLLFIAEGNTPVLVIVSGDSKVDMKKLSRVFKNPRLASPPEVLALTGFRVGGVPPVGVAVKTIIDKKVLKNKYVYGGGGSINKLCKIDPRKIVEYQNAEVLDIT